MKKTIILISAITFFMAACSSNSKPSDVNSTPEKVVETIAYAAKNKDFSQLPSLCDPTVDADGDSKRICELKAGGEEATSFIEYFQTLKINGTPEINGDEAKVPILFGKDGTKDETFNLKKVNDKWYLSSF